MSNICRILALTCALPAHSIPKLYVLHSFACVYTHSLSVISVFILLPPSAVPLYKHFERTTGLIKPVSVLSPLHLLRWWSHYVCCEVVIHFTNTPFCLGKVTRCCLSLRAFIRASHLQRERSSVLFHLSFSIAFNWNEAGSFTFSACLEILCFSWRWLKYRTWSYSMFYLRAVFQIVQLAFLKLVYGTM